MEFSNLKVYENIYDKCDSSVNNILIMINRVNTYNNKVKTKTGDYKDGSEVRESER